MVFLPFPVIFGWWHRFTHGFTHMSSVRNRSLIPLNPGWFKVYRDSPFLDYCNSRIKKYLYIYIIIYVWGFPAIGVPPNHPFLDGIFPFPKTIQLLGTLKFMETTIWTVLHNPPRVFPQLIVNQGLPPREALAIAGPGPVRPHLLWTSEEEDGAPWRWARGGWWSTKGRKVPWKMVRSWLDIMVSSLVG